MNLTFSKDANGFWIANFEVAGDFAIHVEKGADGALYTKMSTVAGAKYADVPSLYMQDRQTVMDQGVVGVIYPVYLQLEVRTKEMPYAVISSEGDVLDITNVLNTPV